MGRKAGALLWNRMYVTFPLGVTSLDVDTGLTQPNKSFADYSLNEPGFANPSRIQVVPLAPTVNWANTIHSEPTFSPVTGTIHVTFIWTGLIPEPPAQVQMPPINVLFWDPHSMVGPGEADTYNPPV